MKKKEEFVRKWDRVRTPDRRMKLAGWVENLSDEEYLVNIFDSTNGNADPRNFSFPGTAGVSFRLARD